MVGSPTITPRDGYPLYFALGGALLHLTGGDPARSLNLASAVQGAIACGILVVVASEVSGSVLAGIASALLFAGSYTFWSQSIIAEVYALHMLFVALTLYLLLRWEKRPTLGRLGAFFAMYALGFGNHLSMILLAPAYTLFLLASAPRGWRSMFTPPVIALAVAAAASGAMQYAWNLRTLWLGSFPPHGLIDALGTAWFDITKSDWRETMVMQVPRGMAGDHASMYAFDVLQQFGWIGPLLAAVGLAGLLAERWRVALLIAGAYLVNALFAYSYKVGDAHVFYLPSHLMIALLMAPGIVVVARLAARFYRARVAQATAGTPGTTAAGGATAGSRLTAIAALVVIAYAGLRIYRDYPALDRSNDHRPTDVLRALTAGLDDRHAILLVDLNWQLQNGLSYFARVDRPDLAYARMPDVLLYAPELIRDNLEIGREVALTDRARAELVRSYGPLIPTIADSRVDVPGISDLVQGLAPGTPYVLSILKPVPDFSLDADDLIRAIGHIDRWAAEVDTRRRLRGGCWSRRSNAFAGGRRERAVSPEPQPRRRRGRDPDGIVARVRHHPADGIRSRDCRAPPHADHRTGRELRHVRPVRQVDTLGIRLGHLRPAASLSLLSLRQVDQVLHNRIRAPGIRAPDHRDDRDRPAVHRPDSPWGARPGQRLERAGSGAGAAAKVRRDQGLFRRLRP